MNTWFSFLQWEAITRASPIWMYCNVSDEIPFISCSCSSEELPSAEGRSKKRTRTPLPSPPPGRRSPGLTSPRSLARNHLVLANALGDFMLKALTSMNPELKRDPKKLNKVRPLVKAYAAVQFAHLSRTTTGPGGPGPEGGGGGGGGGTIPLAVGGGAALLLLLMVK